MAGIWDMCVFFNVCIQNVGLYEITRLIAILVDALSDKKTPELPIVCFHGLSEHMSKCLFMCTEDNKTGS